MARLRPGWLVTLCAAILAVSVWLPWLTTSALGGGRANAIGGTVGSLVLPRGFGVGQLIVLLTSTLLVAGAMPAPAEILRLTAERFGPPHRAGEALFEDGAAERRARLREAVGQARAAAGPDAALRVLAIDPDSRVPERRAVLTPFE